VPKKAQITQKRVEYNVFLFDEPPKGSKSLKIFKISLTFRFDKLSNLSKSVHTGENSQILTVANKKVVSSIILYLITLQILSLCVLQIKRELRIKCGSKIVTSCLQIFSWVKYDKISVVAVSANSLKKLTN
jgi:hypothetical protein